MDHALVNILTLILGFVAGLILLTWFCFRSSYAQQWRFGLLGAIAMAIGIAVATLKVVEVDGNMIPRFAWRWTPTADSQLGRVEPGKVSPGVAPEIPSATVDPAFATNSKSDFPEFLGPGRENYLPGPKLATDWKAHPPREIWRRPIGAGWSAFSVVGGQAVTMEQRGDDEWVTCYDVATGKPLWGTCRDGPARDHARRRWSPFNPHDSRR